MRVVQVTGSRNWTAPKPVWARLEELAPDLVISGGARGLDQLAERWAQRRSVALEVYRADWDRYGKAAGFRRNEVMARRCVTLAGEGHEVLVEAWPIGESRGTWGMVQLSVKLGLSVVVHEEGQ